MAVRSTKRSNLGKRSHYVAANTMQTSVHDDYSSSDDDSSSVSNQSNKVRDVKSIKMLLKASSSYEKSDEHGYTQPCVRPVRCKRPRKYSESDEMTFDRVSKKPKCESKNAINARINRERKKAYLAAVEEEVDTLKEANDSQNIVIKEQKTKISELVEEVSRLRSVLANNQYLAALVGKLSNITGLPVTSSLVPQLVKMDKAAPEEGPRIRSVVDGENHPIAKKDVSLYSGIMDDFDPAYPDQTDSLFPSIDENIDDFDPSFFLPDGESKNVGICVHINQERLSVEFCSLCNERASSNYQNFPNI